MAGQIFHSTEVRDERLGLIKVVTVDAPPHEPGARQRSKLGEISDTRMAATCIYWTRGEHVRVMMSGSVSQDVGMGDEGNQRWVEDHHRQVVKTAKRVVRTYERGVDNGLEEPELTTLALAAGY